MGFKPKRWWSWCHKCHGPQACPCVHCVARNGVTGNEMIENQERETHECPHCGVVVHIEESLDIEYQQIQLEKTLGIHYTQTTP